MEECFCGEAGHLSDGVRERWPGSKSTGKGCGGHCGYTWLSCRRSLPAHSIEVGHEWAGSLKDLSNP